jgi:hypothetical protein
MAGSFVRWNSADGAIATIFPSLSIATQSEMEKISGISWLTITAVKPNARCMATIRSWMVLAMRGSSPVVGSSNRMISGSITSARAKPARFFMPPLNSAGNLWPMPERPTCASFSSTRLTTSASGIRSFSRSGNATFSKTVKESNKAAPWNNMANRLRTSLSAFPRRREISIPSTQTSPRSGWRRPMICLSSTLLPSPLPPMMVVSFPAGMVRSTPRNTGCPPSVFFTPTSLIIIYR